MKMCMHRKESRKHIVNGKGMGGEGYFINKKVTGISGGKDSNRWRKRHIRVRTSVRRLPWGGKA